MTGLEQARHVAFKDMRLARMWVGAWLVLLVLATATSAAWSGLDGAAAMLAVLTVLAVVLIAGVVVQQDEPIEPDAFWATRPLRPSAVWLGKVLSVAVVLILPAVGAQALALVSFAADGPTLVRTLSTSTGLLAFWAALAMAVASSTRSMRQFILVMLSVVGVIPVLAFGAMAVGTIVPPLPAYLDHPAWRVVWPVVLLGVVAWHYSRRRAELRVAAIVLTGVVAVAALYAKGPSAEVGNADPDLPAGAMPLTAGSLRPAGTSNGLLRYEMLVSVPAHDPDHRFVVMVTHAWIEGDDAIRDPVGAVHTRSIDVGMPRIAVDLDQKQVDRVLAGEGRLVALGELVLQQRHTLPPLPLLAGSTVVVGGAMAKVRVADREYGTVEVSIVSLARLEGRRYDPYDLVLLSDDGAIPLRTRDHRGGVRFMVLPFRPVALDTHFLHPMPEPDLGSGPGSARVIPPHARLSITEWREVERRSATITLR